MKNRDTNVEEPEAFVGRGWHAGLHGTSVRRA